MEKRKERIMGIIQEHYDRGEVIYLDKISRILDGEVSKRTIQKILRELVQDMELDEYLVTVDGATYKFLYARSGTDNSIYGRLDEVRMKMDIMMRTMNEIKRKK